MGQKNADKRRSGYPSFYNTHGDEFMTMVLGPNPRSEPPR